VLGVIRLKACDLLLDAVASLSSAKGRELSPVLVPFGGELRCISETWHWHRIISSYRKMGREESTSRGAASRRSTQESSNSWAFVRKSASAGGKRDSSLLLSGFARRGSGEMGKSWEKEKGDAGSLTLMENPPQPKRNMEALIRKKTFFRKDPFPPLMSKRSSYYPKSINLSTIISIFLFSPEVRVPLFEKGVDSFPVIFTFQAGLLALNFKI